MVRPVASAWSRAAAINFAEASNPVTSAPSRASGSVSNPAPQPTSSAALLSSGVREHSSHCQCWSTWSRTYFSRTGFNLCSIASDPFGSHQSPAWLENCSTSPAMMLVTVTSSPCLLHLQSGRTSCVEASMDHFELTNGELYCEQVPLVEIAASVG